MVMMLAHNVPDTTAGPVIAHLEDNMCGIANQHQNAQACRSIDAEGLKLEQDVAVDLAYT